MRRFQPAVMSWLPEYNWRKNIGKDVVAGITIGVLLIPQGLAYSVLAGLPPVYGVYTGIPTVVYFLFGTSRHAAIGPMSLPALLLATAVSDLDPAPGSIEEYTGQIMALTLISGILLLAMGILKVGFVVRFISQPVLSGFTSAAAVLTIMSVARDLLGVSTARSKVLHTSAAAIVQALPGTHVATLVTGIASLFLLYLFPKVKYLKKVPAALLVVVLSIAVFAIWMSATKDAGTSFVNRSTDAPAVGSTTVDNAGAITALTDAFSSASPSENATVTSPTIGQSYYTRSGIALVGKVPSTFPKPSFPPQSRALELIPAAISVSFVSYIESIAVANMYAAKHGYETAPSSELKALGLTNIFGSVIAQSFLVMGAFGRSAVNESAGAKSQISGVVSAFVVVGMLLFVMPALFYLPKATLAALIVMAVVKLISVGDCKRLWKVDKRDWLCMFAAFIFTLFMGVLPGIVTSMGFSLLLFIAITTQPEVQELGRLSGTVIYREVGMVGVSRIPDVKIIRFLAPLFFANSSVLKDRLQLELANRKRMPPRLQWQALVLDFQSIASIDSTSIKAFEEGLAEYKSHGIPVLIAGANTTVERFIKKSGIVEHLGGEKVLFRRVHEAVRAVLLAQTDRATVASPACERSAIDIAGASLMEERGESRES